MTDIINIRCTTLTFQFDILPGIDFDADTKKALTLLETK